MRALSVIRLEIERTEKYLAQLREDDPEDALYIEEYEQEVRKLTSELAEAEKALFKRSGDV